MILQAEVTVCESQRFPNSCSRAAPPGLLSIVHLIQPRGNAQFHFVFMLGPHVHVALFFSVLALLTLDHHTHTLTYTRRVYINTHKLTQTSECVHIYAHKELSVYRKTHINNTHN